jgi:hypothetical protein
MPVVTSTTAKPDLLAAFLAAGLHPGGQRDLGGMLVRYSVSMKLGSPARDSWTPVLGAVMAATALVASGTNVKTAQVRLGHASPQMTLRVHAQADQGADRAAANRIGELFRRRDGSNSGE